MLQKLVQIIRGTTVQFAGDCKLFENMRLQEDWFNFMVYSGLFVSFVDFNTYMALIFQNFSLIAL